MPDIEIFKKNESLITLQCNHIISKELSNYFSCFAPNYRFTPLFKQGIWDGKIKFFSSNNELGIGLIEEVYSFAKNRYKIKINFDRFNEISRDDFLQFVKELKLPIQPRDYQLEAAYDALCKKHLNIHISTAGGKSLVYYIICRFLTYLNKKILIVVPSVQLVEQIFSDFNSYGWNSEKNCHRIYAGQKKFFDSPVIISSWQSLIKNKEEYKKIDCLIVDEAQIAKGKSIQQISRGCSNAEYRFGFSGTYPDYKTADWFSIVGALGPIKTFASYNSLQKSGYISQILIYPIILEYDKQFKREVFFNAGNDYHKQIDIINQKEERIKFICKMVQNLEKNTLVLFTKKETHGYKMRDYFLENLKDKKIFYIDGDIDIDLREDIKKIMEEENNVVLLASFGCFSAGINIKNIHNIIFSSGYKSRIKVLQSIGRGLRLHQNKKYLKLFDIVDDVSFIDKNNSLHFVNISLKHYKERIKMYNEQGWTIKSVRYKI